MGGGGTNRAGIVAIVGAVMLGVGSLLPWAKASVGVFERTYNGTEGDGVITLVIAVAAGLFAAFALLKPAPSHLVAALVLGLGVIAAAVSIYDAANLADRAAEVESVNELVDVSMGAGLILCIIGSGVVVIGALLAFQKGEQTEEPRPSGVEPLN